MKNDTSARGLWVSTLEKVARPMLDAAAEGKLRETMWIQQQPRTAREEFSCFEGAGRLLCGMAPWLEPALPEGEERTLQQELAEYQSRNGLVRNGRLTPQTAQSMDKEAERRRYERTVRITQYPGYPLGMDSRDHVVGGRV